MDQGPKSSPGDTPRRSTLLVRLAAWIAVVLALLSGPLWSMAGHPDVDVAWNLAGATVMLVLLESTPPGAIRLPPAISWVIVVAGAYWLLVAHGSPGMVVVFVGLAAALHSERTSTAADGAGRWAWVVAPYLWHSIMWTGSEPGPWFGPLAPNKDQVMVVWCLAGWIALAGSMFCLKGRWPGAKTLGWACWFAAGAATVWLVVSRVPPP